jgi:predicted N-acetyltransferase YhbS
VEIRRLEPDGRDGRSRRKRFRCGHAALDRWFDNNAGKSQRCHGVTYVAEDGGELVGFVTVAASTIGRDAVGTGDGPEFWPTLLLGRMGTLESRKGQGIGERLVHHVFKLALEQAETTGCAAVVVDAKPGLEDYYRGKFGFQRTVLQDDSPNTRMFLLLDTVRAAIAAP